MATIQIADKPTLDAVKTTVDSIKTTVGKNNYPNVQIIQLSSTETAITGKGKCTLFKKYSGGRYGSYGNNYELKTDGVTFTKLEIDGINLSNLPGTNIFFPLYLSFEKSLKIAVSITNARDEGYYLLVQLA